MDELTLHWYFYNWLEDQEEEVNKMKEFGCFVGSFTNYEMAKKILDKNDSNSGNSVSVSDDDMEKAMEFVMADTSYKDLKKKKKPSWIFKLVVFFVAETNTKEVKLSAEHIGFAWLPIEEAIKKTTFKNSKKLLKEANDFVLKSLA